MIKDESIEYIVKKVKSLFKEQNLQIIDYWDADTCSIGLKYNNKLLYINTFPYVGKQQKLFDYDLEVEENGMKRVTYKERGKSETDLITDIRTYLISK